MRPGPVLATVRGVLQVTLAMMAVASMLGWVMLGFIAGASSAQWAPSIALVLLAILYGLLGFAMGSVMGRRQGRIGLTCALLGTMLTWGIFEFFFYLYGIGGPELRAPLLLAVPLSAIGGVVGMSRAEDRKVGAREREAEAAEVEREEGERE